MQSHYEKVARLFNGPDAVHPGIVLVVRVDCALKDAQINAGLCNRFSIHSYPTLLWGPPPLFASGGWKPRQEKSGIKLIDDKRTADSKEYTRLVVTKHKLSTIEAHVVKRHEFNLEDEKHEKEDQLLPNASDPEQILVETGMPSVVENISKLLPYASDPEEVHDLKRWVHAFLKAARELFKIPEKMADIWGKHGGSRSSSANLSGGPGAVDLKEASVSNGGAPGGADRHISRAAFGRNLKGYYFQDLRSARKANKL
ncbi:Sulfhydryl oxidase 1 [Asimina triloba]